LHKNFTCRTQDHDIYWIFLLHTYKMFYCVITVLKVDPCRIFTTSMYHRRYYQTLKSYLAFLYSDFIYYFMVKIQPWHFRQWDLKCLL